MADPTTTLTRGGARAWGVWGVAAVVYFLALLHRTSLGVAALDAQRRFHVGPGALSAFAVLQLVVYLSMQVPAGVLADRVGPRRMLTFGLVAMGLGATLFSLVTSLPGGLAGRALVGLGDACVFLNVLRVAQNWHPPIRYAVLTALTGLAGGAGQLLTTFPLERALAWWGWTTTFAVAGLVTLAVALVAWPVLADAPEGSLPPLLPRLRSRGMRHRAADITGVLREIVARPGTRQALWVHFSLMGPFVAFTALWGFPWLVRGQGLSRPAASVFVSVCVVAFVAASPLWGAAAARRPASRVPVVLSLVALDVAVWALALAWPGSHVPRGLLVVLVVVTGAGGAVSLVAFDLARHANPPERGGSASGVVNTGGFISASTALLVVGVVLDLLGGETPEHFAVALSVVPVLALIGGLRVVGLHRAART
jgi:MFS family permease